MAAPHPNTEVSNVPVEEKRILPVIEEVLVTGKTTVETGKVVISKQVTEETVSVDASPVRTCPLSGNRSTNMWILLPRGDQTSGRYDGEQEASCFALLTQHRFLSFSM